MVKIVIETAANAADGLGTLQLVSTVVIGLVAIAVPAAFAWMDRRAKAREVTRRARSFSLAYYAELMLLRDYLAKNSVSNRAGSAVESHEAIQEALTGARESKIPAADLYLLGDAAEPVQRAFFHIRKAEAYNLRRGMFSQQGSDIGQLDMDQAAALRIAHSELTEALNRIDGMLE